MSHGTPDWGLVGPRQTIYGLDDLGETAARLGSPHVWDRRGDVVHLTDFSEGLGIWRETSWGLPAYVTPFTGWARSGAFCVKLVTDGDAAHITGLQADIPMPQVYGMGLEYTFNTRSTHLYWEWYMGWYIGTDHYRASIRWDLANNRLEYYLLPGPWHIFAENVVWEDIDYLLNTGKMVIDSFNWQYSRFILNNRTYPLPGIAVDYSIVLAANYFILGVYLYGTAPAESVGYVDSVIVTQNEP